MIGVIADDLTGASDAAVQFARRGLRSLVVLDRVDPRQIADAQGVAVDTDSRGVSAEVAYARVRQACDQLRPLEPDQLYKKVDSTLRGNLAAEIDAMMDAFGVCMAVVAPAYPAQGRTTRSGVHHVHGVQVHQAEPGRDPKAPVRDADLVRVLRAGSRRDVGHVGLETVRSGAASIRTESEQLAATGVSIVVCDAETDADLRAIADSVTREPDVLWVGSAGLAEQLVGSLGYSDGARCKVVVKADGPVLVVVGSLSEVTRRQVSVLAQRAAVYGVDQRFGFDQSLATGHDTVLVGPPATLARVTADCMQSHHIGGLILTGGETARAVCKELGVNRIQLLDEVERGVPLGLLIGGDDARLPVVTKAGAFGSDKTLLNALEQLKGGNIT